MRSNSKRPAWRHAVIGLVATSLSVLAIEAVLHMAVSSSETAYGKLAGFDLPPLRAVTRSDVRQILDPSAPVEGVVVGGQRITRGDLWGHFRLDPVLGYSYQEDARSTNGWWQSNNLGARDRTDVAEAVPSGLRRVLVFGESFAQGSRLPQESAWPNVMNDRHADNVEVLNFAVDGYSMAQSLLRYRQIRRRLKYDVVVLVFVPPPDLWRDVNTMRQLQNPQWDAPLIPRFVLEDGQLRLVPPLYQDPFDLWRKNGGGLSPELKEHLRRFDRLYYRAKYEDPPLIGRLISYKLFARVWWTFEDLGLRANLMDPESEAMRVSRAIFAGMQQDALADGADFALVVLPQESRWWDGTAGQRDFETWQRMVSFVCSGGTRCVDLLPILTKVPPGDVDRAYDGWHFGPKMNLRIAMAVADALHVN